MNSTAIFSPDRVYRYSLWRTWTVDAPRLIVIGLNPSTADETTDDPTIRRCIGYAKRWDLGGLVMLNLYAYRATKPRDLWRAEDPIGPDNDWVLVDIATHVPGPVLGAWGANALRDRAWKVGRSIAEAGRDVLCLGFTRSGHPRHPLYLRADVEPEVWMPKAGNGGSRV
jgi:hypothetical protein